MGTAAVSLLTHAAQDTAQASSGFAVAAGVAATAATVVGGVLGFRVTPRNYAMITVVGLGLLVMAAAHLLPEIIAGADRRLAAVAAVAAMIGYGVAAALGRLRALGPGHAYLAPVALVVHRGIEAATAGAAFALDTRAGIFVIAALAVHAAAEGCAMTAIVVAGRGTRRAASAWLLALALAPLAGVLAFRALHPSAEVLVVLLALIGGVLARSGVRVIAIVRASARNVRSRTRRQPRVGTTL